MTEQRLHDIRLNDQQLAHLKSFLRYALKVYTAKREFIHEDVEVSLLELMATIKEQTRIQ
jgi:hypothetical protein